MTRKSITPRVRKDGVSFVDMEHFHDGSPIAKFVCTRKEPEVCGFETTEVNYSDQSADKMIARAEVTGGFYGPNGNGYNYWCPKCEYRMNPIHKNKEALDSFFGFTN